MRRCKLTGGHVNGELSAIRRGSGRGADCSVPTVPSKAQEANF